MLILDEPLARLDPLARHEFLGVLMAEVVAESLSVIFSSHVLAEFVLTSFAIAVAPLALSEPRLREVARDAGSRWNASFVHSFYSPHYPDLAMQMIPLPAALFVGTRLASRELEDGTAAFAWTQGYGKRRRSPSRLLSGQAGRSAADRRSRKPSMECHR